MSPARRRVGTRSASSGSRRDQHIEWLKLIEVSGPFLSVPVLAKAWPDLDPFETAQRESLRRAHADWQADGDRSAWISYVLRDFLGWAEDVRLDGDFRDLELEELQHETIITPSFTLTDPADGQVKLLGMISDDSPVTRIKGSDWPATPADRLAQLCRARGVELGLATDGRWWALVWAPAGGVTTVAVFDAIAWPDSSERMVVRAFLSLLTRNRWFAVPPDSRLPALLRESVKNQEDITEQLGVQVRQAVELLVAAFARSSSLDGVTATEVYQGAVAVMMRLVFLLFAEESGLLPADNPLYSSAYSVGKLYQSLEQRVADLGGNEAALDHMYLAWHRLLALFSVVYRGVRHPELKLTGHDGSLFSPDAYQWMPLTVSDRTVLHMLRSVQTVTIKRELRTVSFRTLTVEQIGYVYEGLLSFGGYRATEVILGLIGKEGREEEVPLSALLSLGLVDDDLPRKLAEKYKDSGIGSPRALSGRLAPLSGEDEAQARSRLYAATKDNVLVRRLLPYYGIIRRDLRGDPVVILPGQLYVTESALRASTGTHYTPRFLAEQVAEGALEPLVYSPGPLHTADRSLWHLRSPGEILSLKVADIAMGSGAFLVAACRYLAGKLIEAKSLRGNFDALRVISASPVESGLDLDVAADPVIIEARREVIEHCLYGVDINEMAVEMAKLSLWLVSMDPDRPFTFLDDKLACGDSLLGITSIEQLEYMHIKPSEGRRLHEGVVVLDFMSGVRPLIEEVIAQRNELVRLPDDFDGIAKKREVLKDIRTKTAELSVYADLISGTALAKGGWIDAARQVARGPVEETREVAARLLAKDQPDGAFDRRPLHWPLVFPEVNGFDAIIGNPPFLGGWKIRDSVGDSYKDHMVDFIANDVRGIRGTADLAAYFALRAHSLINVNGQLGLVTTNSISQGDTRTVGLAQIIESGAIIRRSIKSEPWPSNSAAIEYSAVWISRAQSASAERVADGLVVSDITSSLDPSSRVAGRPYGLLGFGIFAFHGWKITGEGFLVEHDRAGDLIAINPRNREVLFPYLNGKDVNSRPDCSASRWVINFHNWTEEKAKSYPECYEQVWRLVRPERANNKVRSRRERWWLYSEYLRSLVEATSGLDRVIVIARISKTVMPVIVSSRQVLNEKLVVFTTGELGIYSVLSSGLHYWWAITYSSTMKADLNYSATDVFETLPLPELTQEMREQGGRLDVFRRNLMLARRAGLTATYNLVHDPTCTDDDIAELREIHRAIDVAVVRAYGWTDLLDAGLDHGFHDTRQGTRYTIGPVVRQEVLDRLLELNHARYAEEVRAGLHNKKASRKRPSKDDSQDNPLF